jgi:hypothetical protein
MTKLFTMHYHRQFRLLAAQDFKSRNYEQIQAAIRLQNSTDAFSSQKKCVVFLCQNIQEYDYIPTLLLPNFYLLILA